MSTSSFTPEASLSCSVCTKSSGQIFRCGGWKSWSYCGRAFQTSDWKPHKKSCDATPKWHDKHRMCRDGNKHEGRLELVTWELPNTTRAGVRYHFLTDASPYLTYTSFYEGACDKDTAEEVKRYFETGMGGEEELLFKYMPIAFRWTCCGTHARKNHGCDHHGTGSYPCTCDFCRMGKPLPPGIWSETDPFRHGLCLRHGPDPRSFHRGLAIGATVGRTMLGLEMPEDLQ
ncbi:hypothetical protein B0H13DRAFT_2300616 [Mycena leptocephala]|nr:hypothetical protein B0H13DRAFT_2300616 [Mycena leptocephala]